MDEKTRGEKLHVSLAPGGTFEANVLDKQTGTRRIVRLLIFGLLGILLYLQISFAPAQSRHHNKHALPDLYEASIAELQDGLEKGLFTSVDLVKAYFARIDEVNMKGPMLRAIIEINPSALEQAAALDEERRTKGPRGPLHGIPIMLKDNIATIAREGMNTTAGSFALLGSVPPRDATVAAKLRTAGAIILGKANLSEWSHSRGSLAPGWSGRGGQTTSAYCFTCDASGSSSGSGVASSIGLAAASLGTETDGSIILPSSKNNLVGIKPTVGLTSRAGVIPISEHQDTVGPMTRSVADAATILTVIAGPDPLDNYTLAQPVTLPDYTSALVPNGLEGIRLGVPRSAFPYDESMVAVFNATLDVMRELGATIVDPADYLDIDEMRVSENETIVLRTDLKFNLQNYIGGLLEVPTGVKNLSDLITFNLEHADKELPEPFYNNQSVFLQAVNTTKDDAYFAAISSNVDLGRTRGIDGTLEHFGIDALVLPSEGASALQSVHSSIPPCLTSTIGYSSTPAAIAGYPVITVPLGFQQDDVVPGPADPIVKKGPGMPFGLAFVGTAFKEFDLIKFAYAYEQATHTRLARLAYPAAIPKTQLVDIMQPRI
ncbi:amidase signature enzyme [Vararia minispora EC-137]|uniref:Amidase signature enzyme n=1 Tax=Vararia minispora EC-137 TaxID=1314806 RepID=A0ACB8QG18_9AGAM|nr:amidase signature enzyme [Vararia minispora EC-137]